MNLEVPFDGVLNVRAKSEYRTDRRNYKDVLTMDQAKIIENRFNIERKLFGYEF